MNTEAKTVEPPSLFEGSSIRSKKAKAPAAEAEGDGARVRGKRKRKSRRQRRSRDDASLRGGAVTAPFPRTTLEDALALGTAIQQHAAGQQIRRVTLFEKLNKSPDSGPSRTLITNSGKYGITTGSYAAEHLELTALGAQAADPEGSEGDRLKARFELGIKKIPAFNFLYESLRAKRVPSPEVMRDSLAGAGIGEAHRQQAVDLFLENAKFLGLLRTSAGAQRLAPIEQMLEELPIKRSNGPAPSGPDVGDEKKTDRAGSATSLEEVCFVIAPIDEEGSEQRRHSDMVLEALIGRALERDKLSIVRADRIGDPGMISGQVINYLLHAKLVIADLSFHNPNVFYELAIRHMTGLPTVHLIRRGDQIPFDVKDFRTIVVDTTDKYDLVAKLDTYRAEIANHVRIALSSGTEGSNPIRTFARHLVVDVGS